LGYLCIEVDHIGRIGKACIEIGAPAGGAVHIRQCMHLLLVAPDQDRVRHHHIAVCERHTASLANGDNRAREMLIGSHSSSDAIHNDTQRERSHRTSFLPKKERAQAARLDSAYFE
jgi:hypothetical protein